MKKLQVLFVALAAILFIGTAQTADAQRRNNGRRHTATPSRTPQRTTTQTQRFVKEVACYQLDCGVADLTVTQDYVYYIEDSNNNAVRRINRKTGEVETVIQGQAGLYEGRRANLQGIDFAGGKTIYAYGPYSTDRKIGIMIDGQLKTYKDNWKYVFATNGKYALIGCSFADCINLENMTYAYQDFNIDFGNTYVMQPDGSLWWPYADDGIIGAKCKRIAGQPLFYSLSNEPYVVNEHIRYIGKMRAAGNYIYVACSRRIYAMNVQNPGTWIEYVKVPPTMNYRFGDFWVNNRGDVLACDGMIINGRVQLFRAGSLDTPQSLGRGMYIDTGMTQTGYNEISLFQTTVYPDADNNWVIINGRSIRIYNPDGVVGYEKARGKIIKI